MVYLKTKLRLFPEVKNPEPTPTLSINDEQDGEYNFKCAFDKEEG